MELPDHPEPMVMRWSELEKRAIREFGERLIEMCAKTAEKWGADDAADDIRALIEPHQKGEV